METSEWLSVALSLFGVASGAGISWLFFRTQLLADFGKLQNELKVVTSMQLDLAQKIDLSKEIKDGADISAIKSTVQKLDKDLNLAVKEILSDVKEQQKELANKIQYEFRTQSKTATNSVKAAFSSEVSKYISNKKDQEQLLSNLVSSFMDGMHAMGEYQRINIEKETVSSISSLEGKITESIDNVVDEVVSLKKQVTMIPSKKRSKRRNK